jgi:hypothetical protein
MNAPRRGLFRVLGWIVAGVLAVATAAGVGIAFAGPSGGGSLAGQGLGTVPVANAPASPSASPQAPKPGEPGRHGRFGGRFFPGLGLGPGKAGLGKGGTLLHGEFSVKGQDGKVTTMVVQHGAVTAVSSTSVSLKSDDGFTGTYAVDGNTRVMVGGGRGAISGVKTGNEAWVTATKGSTSTATVLIVRS